MCNSNNDEYVKLKRSLGIDYLNQYDLSELVTNYTLIVRGILLKSDFFLSFFRKRDSFILEMKCDKI